MKYIAANCYRDLVGGETEEEVFFAWLSKSAEGSSVSCALAELKQRQHFPKELSCGLKWEVISQQ